MGSLTVALRAAQSGLLSTQSAVDASAKNIANVNTEGYSRKIVNFENRVLAGQGSGTQLSDFSRAIDDGLVEDLRRELSEMTKLESQAPYYERLQNLFGAPGDNTSISHIISQFEQAAETLALSPDKTLEQNELIRFANDVALELQGMTQELQALRAQADQDISDVVDEINALTAEIADANDQIIRSGAISNDITDLLDKRDLALTKLSELVDINTFPRSDGDLVVFSSDGFSLVDRTANLITHSPVGIVGTTSTYAEGDINGVFVGNLTSDNDITNRVTGGSLSGLIQQRDEVLPNLQSQLDELARELVQAVNQIHNRGAPYPGLQSMSGTREFIDTSARAQIDTVTIGSTGSNYEAGDIYSVVVNGSTVSFTLAGGETLTQVRDALVAAINTDSTVGPIVTAKAGAAAGVLTLTADVAGTAFTATASATNGGATNDNTATISTTTANAGEQTIKLDPTNGVDDVTIALFDSNGVQQAVTTLNTIMVSGAFGSRAQTSHGAWSIAETAAAIEDWFQDNGASSASVAVSATTGKLNIDLNNTSLYVAFRDQTASANGSSQADASIGFDSDGDGDIDETVSGFSNFFGLNDLYTDSTDGSLYQSDQISNTFSTSAATLTFYDATVGVGTGNALGSVSIAQAGSLTDMVNAINNASIGVTASLIPDGSGSRLRIQHDDGLETVITQATGNTLLTDMNVTKAQARSAATIAVRADILATPSLTTTALMQYNTDSSKYEITAGDNTVIQALATMLASKNGFDATGGLSTSSKTFDEYAADILSRNSNLANTNESQLKTQQSLTDTLKLESNRISGVNLDEEMSNLVLFQQAFSASARVISVIQEMFKTLENAVR